MGAEVDRVVDSALASATAGLADMSEQGMVGEISSLAVLTGGAGTAAYRTWRRDQPMRLANAQGMASAA